MTLGTVRHATRPVALCTPDLLAIRPDNVGRLTSVKCPRHGWDWGPVRLRRRAAGLRAATSVEHAICSSFMPAGALDAQMDLAALVNGELRVYPFTADAELQGWMLDDAEAWWKRHITDGIEPPPRRIGRRAGLPEAEVETDGRDAHSHRPRGVAARRVAPCGGGTAARRRAPAHVQATGGGRHRE